MTTSATDSQRRRALRVLGTLAASPLAWRTGPVSADTGTTAGLNAAPTRLPLLGAPYPDTGVWAYDNAVPGPVLRVRQGEPLTVTVSNGLAEATTVHWHGIRLPNAMDGVPDVTQPAIAPGGRFEYRFVPPDAGTFWYHPHTRGNVQVDMGLHGALIVEEREPVAVDRDLLWVLDDWRLLRDGQAAEDFDSPMDRTHAGRIGNTVTINGRLPDRFDVKPGERIRLRLLNVANARIFSLAFEGHAPTIVALDGMPCEPTSLAGGRLVLGPGMRADVILDADAAPGSTHRVIDDFLPQRAYEVVTIAYASGRASTARRPALRLPANRIPEPDLANATRHVVTFTGGMMGGGMMGGGMMGGGMMGGGMMGRGMMGGGPGGRQGHAMTAMHAWSINGVSASEADHSHEPILTLKRGDSYVLQLRNETAWWHPIHLHGHSFRVLRRVRNLVPGNPFVDTALLAPRETVEIAFVADNPGDWMFHCHVLEHQASGMMATVRVA